MISELANRDPSALTIFFAVILLGILLIWGRSLRGTTLNAARWWSVASVATLLAAEMGGNHGVAGQWTARYVAAVTTFCPLMAVLGAKRPQHGAWQMIVFSLWLVLALPAAESYFVRRGAEVQIHDARGWFLWVLLVTGCLNYVGTRHGLAVVVATAGQIVLLSPHLPMWRRSLEPGQVACGMGLFLAAAILVVWRSRSQGEFDDPREAWLGFRDRWGTFWSLRVAERFNTQAAVNGWPCRLGHSGFLDPNGRRLEAPSEMRADAKRLLRSLLSRFVVVDDQQESKYGLNPADPNAPT